MTEQPWGAAGRGRKGVGKRSLIGFLSLLIVFSVGSTSLGASRWVESAKEDLAEWPDRLIQDSKDALLQRDHLGLLLMAGAASFVMNNTEADDNVAGYFERHRTFEGFWDNVIYTGASPPAHIPAAVLWYGISAQNQDDIGKERAWTMVTALTISGGVTLGLKAIRDNDTPNGKPWAWPSGHTASSFTVASVLHQFYGWEVGLPAYGLAGLVAYRMMDTGDHWASDIVFGATLGCLVGHSVAGKNPDLKVAGCQVVPYFDGADRPVLGVGLARRF